MIERFWVEVALVTLVTGVLMCAVIIGLSETDDYVDHGVMALITGIAYGLGAAAVVLCLLLWRAAA